MLGNQRMRLGRSLTNRITVMCCRYIIPCVAFNIYYQGKPERQARSFFRPGR